MKKQPECIDYIFLKIDDGIKEYREQFLLGLIDKAVNDNSYNEILEFAKALIEKETIVNFKKDRAKIISIALVLFAIREYKREQFWSEFSIRLNIEQTLVIYESRKAFEDFCEENNLYFHIGSKNKGYVTSILVHAILPNDSMEKFVGFLQEIYFKDLEEEYIDEEVYKLLKYMIHLFEKYIEDDDINFVVDGSKMTIASQQLPKAFRIAFVKAPDVVGPIIEKILYYIDQLNYRKSIEYLEENRFDNGFKSYVYNVDKSINKFQRRKSKNRNIKRFRKACYYCDGEKLYLQIPRQIIEADYIENDIFLEVLNDESVIYRERALLTESRLFFRIEQVEIPLNNFYSKLSFRLVSEERLIYSSEKLLFRDFILFNVDGNEINYRHLPDDSVRIITFDDEEVLSDDAKIDISFINNYKIYTAFLNEESMLFIGDKMLSTTAATIRNELDERGKYKGVRIKNIDGDYFDAYKEFPRIQLRIPYGKKFSDYIIAIGGINYELKNIAEYKTESILDGSGDELCFVSLAEEIIKDNNPVEFIIRQKGSNKIYLEEKVFIINSLYYEFGKKYYYKEKYAELITLQSTKIEFSDIVLPVKINAKVESEVKINFMFNDTSYQLNLEIPVLRWRWGETSSNAIDLENIWWEDIVEQKIYIQYPNNISSKLYILDGQKCYKRDGKKIGNEYRYSLEEFFQTQEKEPVTLGVFLEENQERIIEINFQPLIRDFCISYNNTEKNNLLPKLFSQWKFIGSGDLFVDIIYSKTKQSIKTYQCNAECIMDPDLELYYGEHEAECYQLYEDFFGEKQKRILYRKSFIVGDKVLAYTKDKVLKGIYCYENEEKYELANFYLKDLAFSKTESWYNATGFYKKINRYTGEEYEGYFTQYNPFVIKPLIVEKERLRVEIIDKDEDGLIYDTKSQYIINPGQEGKDNDRYKLVDFIELEIAK